MIEIAQTFIGTNTKWTSMHHLHMGGVLERIVWSVKEMLTTLSDRPSRPWRKQHLEDGAGTTRVRGVVEGVFTGFHGRILTSSDSQDDRRKLQRFWK